MKAYVKPTIEFIELKPEERLACVSGGGCGGCCSGGGGGGGSTIQYWISCYISSPVILCNLLNQAQKAGGQGSYGSSKQGQQNRGNSGRGRGR